MSNKDDSNIYVGGKCGVFRGVQLRMKSSRMKIIQNVDSTTDDHKISCMSWGDEEETDILLACGSDRNKTVRIYNTEKKVYRKPYYCSIGQGDIVGLAVYKNDVLAAIESGEIRFLKSNEVDVAFLNSGNHLACMKMANKNQYIIGTGGLENPLKLFDLSRKVNIFTAKNVPSDWLQLRTPISVNDLCFLSNDKQIVTVGRYGHIRLYDTLAQRKPVVNLESKDHSITTVSVSVADKQIIYGTGKGKINLVDLRKTGRILNSYRGPVGAITSLTVSNVDNCIVSVSYDRHIYVHDIKTKKMLKKLYVISKLSSMVLRSDFSLNMLKETEDDNDSTDDNFDNTEDEPSSSSSSEETNDAEES